MSNNIFLKPESFYQRQINPLSQYVEQNSYYLFKMTGKPLSECKDFIVKGIREKKFETFHDPIVTFFERDDNGDRHKNQLRLSGYISQVVNNGEILAPTFTTYVPVTVKKSIIVDFIDANVALRSTAKHAAFKAKAEGRMDEFISKNNEQDNRKRYNNSMSGAFVAGGSIVNNPTGHSTLTSITRTMASLGNASNERIISGNRHYRNADVTLGNLISITASLDKVEFDAVIQKYRINYPTVEQTLECIRYSTDMYWVDPQAFAKITAYVNVLEPVERAAVVYIGDLYHLRIYNDDFIKRFLTQLSMRVQDVTMDDPRTYLKKADELIINYAHQVCMSIMRGKGKNYDKLTDADANVVAATAMNIEKTIIEYKDFIYAIFLTNNIPMSTAFIPSMIRRSVVLSDTDSTMFSIDEWVNWYFGKVEFTDDAYALAGSVMYIATQSIAHWLAIFSANINVERAKLFKLAMKPEMVFSVFCQTSVAKHYFTSMVAKEGNIGATPEIEIKGVYMKNSAAPPSLIKDSQSKMADIISTIESGKKIEIVKELKRVADIERKISASLLNGDVEFYKTAKIKNAESYAKSAEQSPYLHHTLWTEVFSPKYGNVEQPPYGVIKIPTSIYNKTHLKNWVDTIADRELADRLARWLARMNKTTLGTMYVSTQYVRSHGIPVEIKSIIDFKRIALELTTTDRMILETLGLFAKVGWLVSEMGY